MACSFNMTWPYLPLRSKFPIYFHFAYYAPAILAFLQLLDHAKLCTCFPSPVLPEIFTVNSFLSPKNKTKYHFLQKAFFVIWTKLVPQPQDLITYETILHRMLTIFPSTIVTALQKKKAFSPLYLEFLEQSMSWELYKNLLKERMDEWMNITKGNFRILL